MPSSETFESSALTSRSGVTISGLISASVASSCQPHLVQRDERVGDALDHVRVGAAVAGDLHAPPSRDRPGQRVDVMADQLLGRLLGDLFDVHAALDAEHHQRLLGRAVEQHRGVVLGGDVRGVLDPQRAHACALDVHPEDVAGVLARLGLVGGELHAAGLAAPADQHLRLDDDRVADLVGRRQASSTWSTALPEETLNPWRANSCLPWYSSRSIAARDSNANGAVTALDAPERGIMPARCQSQRTSPSSHSMSTAP